MSNFVEMFGSKSHLVIFFNDICRHNNPLSARSCDGHRQNQRDTNLSCMELRNRLTNQVREDWYIGSMFGRSVMEKNSTDACDAIGL